MRRRLLVLLCVPLALANWGCQTRAQVQAEPPAAGIAVGVDARMELLAVVQRLSGYDVMVRDEMPYKEAIDEHFAGFREHEAVRLFGEMRPGGFSYDGPVKAMLHLSPPPDLAITTPVTEGLCHRAGGRERLERFVAALRSFAADADFAGFFSGQREFYDRITGDAQAAMGGADHAATLEAYYGLEQRSYSIFLAPLFRGSYGPRVANEDGTFDVYNVTGPWGVNDGHPNYGDAGTMEYLCLHEFGHSFVNPVVDEYAAETNLHSALLEPIADEMKRQAYGGWLTCAHEHTIRAVTARMEAREAGEAAGLLALSREYGRGFRYIKPLYEALQRYEADRATYPTFRDFYPELLEVFEECARHAPDSAYFRVAFMGPINAVLADSDSTVIVLPTNEADAATQQSIHDFATAYRDRFLKGASLVRDTEALEADLAGKYIIAFGTPSGNSYIAQLLEDMPVSIQADRIVADREYAGTGLRLITCRPNPADPMTGVLIYCAQQAKDVVDANAVFHGPTDWVVADGNSPIASGNYDKTGATWTFE